MAVTLDPHRVDGWYYRGQNHRLHGEVSSAFVDLRKAVSLEMPQRSLFQWDYLYDCIRYTELLKAAVRPVEGKGLFMEGLALEEISPSLSKHDH